MWNMLNQVHQQGVLVDLEREKMVSSLRGFVAGVSADFVVMSLVDDHCNFDGAAVVQMEDISLLKWDTDVLRAWTRTLNETPSSPELLRHVELSSWESVVRSVSGREPMLTFHREQVDDSMCMIGINVQVEGESVSADRVSVEGTIGGHFALRLSDLTRLDFAGGYEQALWRMIQSSQ